MSKPEKVQLREAVDLSSGIDELNLAVFQTCLLAFKNPDRSIKTYKKTWTATEEVDGIRRPVEHYQLITGSDEYGLPTYSGIHVLLALLKESHDQGFNEKVYTTLYRLIQIMRWDKAINKDGRGCSGASLNRLERTLNQLWGTGFQTDRFWVKGLGWCDTAFHLIGSFDFPKNRKEPGYVYWDKEFLNKALLLNNIKKLDLKKYFDLSSINSQETFRYADRKLVSHQSHQLDAHDFTSRILDMNSQYYQKRPDKALMKLKPVIREWKEKRIQGFDIKQSKTKSKYKVHFWKLRRKQVAVTEELPKAEVIPPSTPLTELPVEIPSHIPPGSKYPEPVELADLKRNNELLKCFKSPPDYQANNILLQYFSRHDKYKKNTKRIHPFLEYAIIKRGDPQPFYDNDDLIIAIIEQAKLANRELNHHEK